MTFSTSEIIAIMIGGGGLVGCLVGLLTFGASRLDAFRKRREENRQKDISETSDVKRVEIDGAEFLTQLYRSTINDLIAERTELKKQLQDLDSAMHDSRIARSKAFANIREIRTQVDTVRDCVREQLEVEDIKREIENLEGKINTLEAMLI